MNSSRSRIKWAWLATTILLGLLALRAEPLIALARHNVLAAGSLPQTIAGLDGLRWACANTTGHAAGGSPVGSNTFGTGGSGSVLAGQLAAARGDCVTALREWQLVAESDAGKAKLAQFELGRGMWSLGETSAAVEQFRLAGAGYHIYAVGLSRQESGQAAEAQALFELAFAVEPTVQTAEPLAQRFIEAGETDRAAAIWLQLADSTGERDANHWLALAEAATLRQDWEQAGAALTEAFQVADDPYPILLRLGRTRMKQVDWIGAIEAYAKAAALQPSASSEPYSQAGLASANLGRYADAMGWFDRGVRLFPSDPWPRITAGEVANRFGVIAEAERRLRSAVSVAPDHWGALYAYSEFLVNQQRAGEAVPYLERIAKPVNCSVLNMLLMGYQANGDTERSEQTQEQAKVQCH